MKLIRIIGLNLVIAVLAAVSLTQPVSAHVLKADNGVSAVLHIPPDDNPKAGQQVGLYFSFGDDQNHFSLQQCACQVAVKHNSQIIKTVALQPVLSGATLDAVAKLQFASSGVYDVLVQGTPQQNANFKPFTLDYLLRVNPSADEADATDASAKGYQVIIISAGSLIILVMVGYTFIQFGDRYKPKSRRKNDA